MQKKYLKLNDVEAYKVSYKLSNTVWKMCSGFSNFERDTIGKQFVRAVDSISSNIAEGFGRHSKKEKSRFYMYARGSVYECFDWNQKAFDRKIISKENYDIILKDLQSLPFLINSLIKYTRDKLSE